VQNRAVKKGELNVKATTILIAAGTVAVSLAASAALAQQPDKDTLVIGQSVDAPTLDPADISARNASNIGEHIWGTLYRRLPSGEAAPYLAESYTQSEDGKAIVYKIRDGLTCQDGEVLNAEDVAYSFNRAADPALKFTGNTPGYIYSSVGFVKAEVVDPLTVRVDLKAYNPIAFQMLTEVFIHCKDSYEKMSRDEAATHPVGSGPYHFKEWVKDDHITLERNENFKLNPGTFKTIVWRVIPEASTRTADLIAGNVDIITNVSPDQVQAIDNSGSAKVEIVNGTRRIYIGFNQRDKFAATPGGKAIQKPQVRTALQYAVDIPTICETLLNATCSRATGPVNPPNDNTALKPYPYDPAMAEKLLDAAGYPRGADGVRFTLTLQSPNGRYLNDGQVAQAIGQYLSDIGVKTDVQLLDFASVYVGLLKTHDAGPLFLLGSGGVTYSPLSDLMDFATPDAGTNYAEWKDPEFFGKWKDIQATRDPAKQKQTVDEMLKIFYERGPWLLMYFQPDFYGVSDRIAWQARRDERILAMEAGLKKK
jgi:peptide/nickel transport system substrate-binding protein